MASNDRVAILTEDEEELKRQYVLAEPFGTLSLEPSQEPPSSLSSPTGPDAESPAPPSDLTCIEKCCLRINSHLLISKIFYFFFYAAYGSLHPLLAVYYKQLGMTPSQSGLLVGIRYFIEFCSAPFWGVVADRFKRGKAVLLFSVLCWIMFNCGIGFVKEAGLTCKEKTLPNVSVAFPHANDTKPFRLPPANHGRRRRDADWDLFSLPQYLDDLVSVYSSHRRYSRDVDTNVTVSPTARASLTEPVTKGVSANVTITASTSTTTRNATPISVHPSLTNTSTVTSSTTPMNISTHAPTATTTTIATTTTPTTTPKPKEYIITYNEDQVESIFLLILLVIIIGEFFSAPAVTIVDTVTLQYLGRHRDRYGLQRMWGSLGWGLAMLSVGIWIDHTHIKPAIDGAGCILPDYKNYRIAFILFGVLMASALLVATRFDFDTIERRAYPEEVVAHVAQSHPPPEAGSEEAANGRAVQSFQYRDLIRLLCSIRYGTVLFVAWFMGFGYGFVFTFLYWHLEDLKGTTTLFGVCSVLSHVSELAAYFTSHKLIELVGHIRYVSSVYLCICLSAPCFSMVTE